MLYIPGININLLSIIVLNYRGFLIYFENKKIRIINEKTSKIVVHNYIKDNLYKLIKSYVDRAFITYE